MSNAPDHSPDDESKGFSERSDKDVLAANELLVALVGKPLVQFRMSYGIHLEFGNDHEVTIETPLGVEDGDAHWSGEPLTAEAAGALLPLNSRKVTSVDVARDGTLSLGLGSATLTVLPNPMYEAWQARGPQGLLIVCLPGGEHVAVWEPKP